MSDPSPSAPAPHLRDLEKKLKARRREAPSGCLLQMAQRPLTRTVVGPTAGPISVSRATLPVVQRRADRLARPMHFYDAPDGL